MSKIKVFEKVLDVRESEKQTAQKEQLEAQSEFEKVATELYELLKNKELAEKKLHEVLTESSSIAEMKNMSFYIQSLVKKTPMLQKKVQLARRKMEEKQEDLTEAHVEVKKIEKMIENRRLAQKLEDDRVEKILMDEISIQQYQVATKNR